MTTFMITMPVPPSASVDDMQYHQAFIHSMNNLANEMAADQTDHDIAVRIHSAIERAARMTETSPAHLARLLVGYGLRAPRHAFPDSFTAYVDNYTRTLGDNPSLSLSRHHDVIDLNDMWQQAAQSGFARHFGAIA